MPAPKAYDVVLSPFEKSLKQALKLYVDPARLGAESPLASPYFLSQVIQNGYDGLNQVTRGELLRTQIQLAAERLWGDAPPQTQSELQAALLQERATPGTARYAYLVLELRLFQRFFKLKQLSDIWEQPQLLFGSKSEHYRDYNIAIQQLAATLLQQAMPAPYLEAPQPPPTLIGYEAIIDQITAAIARAEVVMLSGAGGVGKSSVGAWVAAKQAPRPVFWFTMRLTLNDNLSSLLTALGGFLQRQQATGLWQYLLAQGGRISDPQVALALVCDDLRQLAPQSPLLCFDELEQLRIGDVTEAWPAHTQLIEFIEGLRGAASMLLLGQRPLLHEITHYTLNGLPIPQILTLWRMAGLALSTTAVDQLYRYTGGNPRLLILCRVLQQEGESIGDILLGLPTKPAMLPILRRVLTRLSPEKQRLLYELAVFRHYVPADRWPQATLDTLIVQRLVVRDGQGGVALLPALREAIYNELVGEQRQQLHARAALLRLEMAEYTAAAWHYRQAGADAKAIRLWYPYLEAEARKGQVDQARVIFDGIVRNRLGASERKALDLIRARLYQLSGELHNGLAVLAAIDWGDTSESYAQSRQLMGQFQDALGQPEEALQSYQQAIDTLARLSENVAHLHYQQGVIWQERLRDQHKAQRHLWQIDYQLQRLQGILQKSTGDYQAARASYQAAVALAETLGDERRLADVEQLLGDLHSVHLKELAPASVHLTRAITLYEQLGDRLNVERARFSLAILHSEAKEYGQAIALCLTVYHYMERVHEANQLASISNTLAEAYFELGDLSHAQLYAQKVIDMENRQLTPYGFYTLGRIYTACADWQRAELSFKQSIRVGEMNNDQFVVAYSQRELGSMYGQMQQFTQAQQALQAALQSFNRLQITAEIAKTQTQLEALVPA